MQYIQSVEEYDRKHLIISFCMLKEKKTTFKEFMARRTRSGWLVQWLVPWSCNPWVAGAILHWWDNEPHRDKTNKMACAPSEDSDQRIRPVWSVFAVRLNKARILSYPLSAQRRLWSDWADALADLSLCWAHMPFCWFCHDAAQMEVPSYPQQNLAISETQIFSTEQNKTAKILKLQDKRTDAEQWSIQTHNHTMQSSKP